MVDPAPALFRTHPPASSLAALGRVSVVLVERRQWGVVQCTFGGSGRALDLVGVARASVCLLSGQRFGTRRLKPSVQDLNLVTKCKWTMGCPRYELGMLSMASKTLLIMLERFPQLSGW